MMNDDDDISSNHLFLFSPAKGEGEKKTFRRIKTKNKNPVLVGGVSSLDRRERRRPPDLVVEILFCFVSLLHFLLCV